jgi:succinyl-diaminopimelate desuccinylase
MASELIQRLVSVTRDLVLIPSTRDRPHDIVRALEFVVNHVDGKPGLQICRYEEQGIPSLVIRPAGIDRPEVLLCAHLDVVPSVVGEEYRSQISEGKIVGPGAGDMKGELAILLQVFCSLHEAHPGISLGLVVTSDEEQGGDHGMRFLFDTVGIRCGTAIIPDSGSLHEIAVEEKGILHLRTRADGVAGHASRPWLADNPLDRLLEALHQLKVHFDQFAEGSEHWYPTLAITMIETPNRVANRIPKVAEATLDIRFPSPYTCQEITGMVATKLGRSISTETIIAAEPVKLTPDPLYLEVSEEITGQRVRLIREHGGSDARFLCKHGIRVIMSRPLVGELHSEREWIDIASMEELHQIYYRYLERKLTG